MTNALHKQITEIRNLITDGFESAEIAHNFILENKNTDMGEVTASLYVNRAISKFTSAKSIYTIFIDELEKTELNDIFYLFSEFEKEFLENLANNDSYQSIPEAYENLKNAIDLY